MKYAEIMQVFIALAVLTSGWVHCPRRDRDVIIVIHRISPVLYSLLSTFTFVTSFHPLHHCKEIKEDTVPTSQRRILGVACPGNDGGSLPSHNHVWRAPNNLMFLEQKMNLEEWPKDAGLLTPSGSLSSSGPVFSSLLKSVREQSAQCLG